MYGSIACTLAAASTETVAGVRRSSRRSIRGAKRKRRERGRVMENLAGSSYHGGRTPAAEGETGLKKSKARGQTGSAYGIDGPSIVQSRGGVKPATRSSDFRSQM